jgi:hypothetical protein
MYAPPPSSSPPSPQVYVFCFYVARALRQVAMSDPDDDAMATWVLCGACNVGQWCKPSEQWTVDKYTSLTCITGVFPYHISATVLCLVIFPNQPACFFLNWFDIVKFVCWSWQILTIEVRVLIILSETTKCLKWKHSHNLSSCQALAKLVSIYRIKQKKKADSIIAAPWPCFSSPSQMQTKLYNASYTLLGAFAKLWKAMISFVMTVCLSACPHGTAQLTLDEFLFKTRNMIFIFRKSVQKNSGFIKIRQ